MSSIRAALRRAATAALAGALLLAPSVALAEGQNKIVYDRFDWSLYSSTHFRVYFYSREKESLQKVVSMAESAYDELSRRLNYQIPKPIPLIFYATHADFEQNNVILNFIPEGVGAFAEPARNRMVLPIDMPDAKLQALIQHELTHIFEYEILFGGKLGRALTANVPTWFMEGLASYLGNDEDEKDRMFLRDAVNSDLIPPITKVDMDGYGAYRYGHAVFDFIEAEWGKDAVRDFVFEFRSFLGRDVSVAVKRSFEIDPDEFDQRFRRYLRKRYLPLLAVKGEASEYGQRFRVGPYHRQSLEIGAAPSPSGDFVATLTTYKDNVDVALLSVKDRKFYRRLTPGRTSRYEYIVGQYLTMGPDSGRDLSFGPDGDRIAVFARHERGRQLVILSAKKGGILEKIPVAADVPLAPAFSPDGRSIVFAGTLGGNRDIWLLDLESKATRNLTNDAPYDSAPVFSRDGRYVYHQKEVAGLHKIVRFPVDDPAKIEQVTWGEGNDEDPAFSPDGKRLYFTSSRNGIYNIYGQDLATGEIVQYTDVIGSAIGPAALVGPDGLEKVVFSGFQSGRFQLYMADAAKPLRKLDEKALPPASLGGEGVTAGFEPAVEVSIDPERVQRQRGFKLFLDNANVLAGVNSDQTFMSQLLLSFSDILGNKRAFFQFDSVSTFSNFRIGYFDLSRRTQFGAQIYDVRTFFLGVDTSTASFTREQRIFKETGLSLLGLYPVSRSTRFELTIGFFSRTLDVPTVATNVDGTQVVYFEPRKDNAPTGGLGFSYDATRYKSFGPFSGNRVDIHYQYAPDLKDSGTLTSDLFLDARQYLPLARRTLLAFRLFAGRSDGNAPTVFYYGGLDTLRGYDFRSQIGNRVFYLNAELRFPLIDVIATPILAFTGIRGRIFFDVGGAWLKEQSFKFWNSDESRLENALAAYGAGFSVYFLGLPWNVDFAKRWNLRTSEPGIETTFYIGYTF